MNKFATKVLHTGAETDKHTGAVSVPIYQVSTFDQNVGNPEEWEYSRSGNPTRAALESIIAELEGGVAGFAFASGIAAMAAAVLILNQGDHVLAPQDVYGGTYRLLDKACPKWGIDHTFVDTTDIDAVKQAVKSNTKALILESPSNPLLKVSDLPALCAWAKEQGIITIVDNTFMTPYLLTPINFGADIVVHSATKFISGHSDVIAGLVVTGRSDLTKEIKFIQNSLGGVLGPQDSWLVMRGIKTLKVRMDQSQAGAQRIAEALSGCDKIRKVYYPGLASHAGHELLKAQAGGFGAVLSFEAQTVELTKKIMTGIKFPALAVSLGGVESILSYPATMSHAAMPLEIRYKHGITDELLRLSVGLEDPDDLIADILQALQ